MQFLEHCEAGIWGSRFGMDEPPLAQADTCSGKLLEAATPCCEADRTEEKKETNLIPNPTPPPPPPPLLPPTFKEATTAAAENEKHDEPPLLFSLSLSLPPLPLQSSPPSAPIAAAPPPKPPTSPTHPGHGPFTHRRRPPLTVSHSPDGTLQIDSEQARRRHGRVWTSGRAPSSSWAPLGEEDRGGRRRVLLSRDAALPLLQPTLPVPMKWSFRC